MDPSRAATPSLQDAASHLAEFMTHYMNLDPQAPNVGSANVTTFEVSWEVANKVGTVYSVLRSKAPHSVAEIGKGNYFLIGPLVEGSWSEVEEADPPSLVVDETIQALREKGVDVSFGHWLVEGNPQVLLIDLESVRDKTAEWLKELERDQQVTIPADDKACVDSVLFGVCASMLLQEFRKRCEPSQSLVAICHDWLTAPVIVTSHNRALSVPTVFVVHAPLLSRYLCEGPSGNPSEMYQNLNKLNPETEAQRLNITHRFRLERLATQYTKVLATVSHITSLETQYLLGRHADVLLPNGLNANKFAALHEFQNKHAEAKAKIHDFVIGHFHGHADFKASNTLYFFSSGRYEFKAKGVDIFLEALARLNKHLKATGSDVTVVAFLVFPRNDTASYNKESLVAQGVTNQLRDAVKVIEDRIAAKILKSAYTGKLPDFNTLLDSQDELLLKRCILLSQRETPPPVTTHVIKKASNDPIMTSLARLDLSNKREDRVKVLFHPRFLSKANPVFAIEYEEFVRGCHLGVFASAYEPWGYTPCETGVLGVPVVTSDLAGFGGHAIQSLQSRDRMAAAGVFVVHRRDRTEEDAIEELTQHMIEFCKLNRKQRIIMRNQTEQTMSALLDWSALHANYTHARELALA
eukprot:c5215_g1_i2.p1 GENE.c5215_g1_i2~~c5215_g1_i2.p1  ORF type:complete len:655 (+),score=192.05 c5215_g1_i2:57-1967(+)